jgi:glycosyltransferase involved in cell wall biosynthesis
MTSARRLDILIPHFNDPSGLAISLASVEAQDWTGNYRVVVADDGSNATERRAMRRVLDATSLPVVLLEANRNRGRPFTRNVLLDAIDGSHVSWLDAGDEWYPARLTRQFAALDGLPIKAQMSTWITSTYDWKWVGAGRVEAMRQHTEGDIVRSLLVGRCLRAYLWTLLGRAESFKAVGWFDEGLPRLQDLDFFLRFALKGGLIETVEPQTALCVYHKSDLGRDAAQIRACNQHVFDKHRVVFERYGRRFVKSRLFEMDLLAARFAMNNNDRRAAITYLARAAARHPLGMAKRTLKRLV